MAKQKDKALAVLQTRSNAELVENPTAQDDQFLTAAEVARLLNLKNVGTVYHMVHDKRLPVTRLSSRCIRFSKNRLAEWLNGLSQPANDGND